MNVKSIFAMVSDFIGGVTGLLGGLVAVGFMSQIVFGTGWLGINVVSNITSIVDTFLAGGLTGLITLVVLLSLWESK